MQAILILSLVAGLIIILFVFLRARRDQGRITALVFLLKAPRLLEEEAVRTAVTDVLGVKLGEAAPDKADWLMPAPMEQIMPSMAEGKAVSFLASVKHRLFLINSFAVPYMENPEKFAESISDLRLRQAVGSHRAWISVDLFREIPRQEERAAIYATLGRILAHFTGDDVLAVYCPELGRCNEYAPAVVEKLQSGAPLTLFDEPTFEPVVQVDSNLPAMKAAVAEARRRWPEFAAAFQQNREPERPFIIKARFRDGENEEFMWVLVQKIEGESISGKLANQPAQLENVKEGETVTVRFEDLNDWVCEISGQTQGGFTMKVMEQALQK